MKKYLCGLAVTAALIAPISAEELFVRNRAFGDAYFVGGTTYVPATSFLKALDVSWTDNGATVNLGSGDSPDSAFDSESVTVIHGDKTLDMTGMMRGGKLYVPAKNLATLVGYTVINNPETGIVDVVKTREYNSADAAAEKELAAAGQAAVDARKAERDARKAKEKAFADAKAKAKADAEASGEDEDEEEVEVVEEVVEEDGDTKTAATKTKTKATADAAEPDEEEKPATEEKPKEPPKANLVVLSNDADPNYYTGLVKFRGVVQNQGFAPAQNIQAAFVVTGPDGKVWVSKTIYRGPLDVDGKWEINEEYKHRLASAMPRGNFTVTITPKFTSAVVPEKK